MTNTPPLPAWARRRRQVAALLAVAAAVTACGGDDDTAATTPQPPATVETPAPDTAEQPSGTPATPTTGAQPAATTEPAEPTGPSSSVTPITADEIPGELVDAAEAEGTVTVYTAWTQETIDQIKPAFEARYDVTLEAVRLSSSAVNQRYLEEQSAGIAMVDVISTAGPELFREYADTFTPIDADTYPNLAVWPSEFVEPNAFLHYIGPQSINYNHDNVPPEEVPETWSDLLNPRWDGKLALADPRSSPGTAAFFLMLEEQEGGGFLSKLAELNPVIVDSVAPAVQQAAAGEFDAVLPGNISHIVGLTTMSPLYMPYTTGFEMFTGIASDGPHPAAAALLVNWLMTEEGQAATVGGNVFRVSPVFEGIEGADTMPPTYYPADTAQGSARAEELFQMLSGR